MDIEAVIIKLFEIQAIKFGEFKLKSGILSPVYINLRVIIGYPKLLRQLSEMLYLAAAKGSSYDLTCGVPYTALPLATCISLDHDLPMVIRRREAKDYGTKQMIEGVYKAGDVCLVVEDVVTSGGSVLETVKELNNVDLVVKDAVVLLDRGQGGKDRLKENGITLHSVLQMRTVLATLLKYNKIEKALFDSVLSFMDTNRFEPVKGLKYLNHSQRKALVTNPIAKRIFEIMESKKTNLAFSADISNSEELLRFVDLIGPYCCVVKTHVDILCDFSEEVVYKLVQLAQKHDFVIFEDRKFADIGNTVESQYSKGVYKISEWAELTNAHAVPGLGVVDGLQKGAEDKQRGCLLIAQMSSSGALTNPSYTKSTVDMAKEKSDFVIGFISTSVVCTDDPRFIHFTPGVSIQSRGDSLGQQYLTPEEVIKNRKCDVIIVGRGIYKAEDPVKAAKTYQEAGYKAYLDLLQ